MGWTLVEDVIKELQNNYNLKDEILITWWSEEDFSNFKDVEQAQQLAGEQMDTCIGHINEYVENQMGDEDEDWLEDEGEEVEEELWQG